MRSGMILKVLGMTALLALSTLPVQAMPQCATDCTCSIPCGTMCWNGTGTQLCLPCDTSPLCSGFLTLEAEEVTLEGFLATLQPEEPVEDEAETPELR